MSVRCTLQTVYNVRTESSICQAPQARSAGPYDQIVQQRAKPRRSAAKTERVDDLSIEQVVNAAIELLDEGGIDSFSMRGLAQRLGRSTMAAYRHVENRDALIRLAAEAVQEDLPDVSSLPWYERLETFARLGWATSWRVHPWVVDYIDSGGVSEQAALRLVAMEQVFRDAGFDEDDIMRALTAHWSFVVGTLRLIVSTRGPAERDAAREDAIFDFNLRTWILGLSAMAKHRVPADFESPTSKRRASRS
jgi:AcrR family transcriptional regulator